MRLNASREVMSAWATITIIEPHISLPHLHDFRREETRLSLRLKDKETKAIISTCFAYHIRQAYPYPDVNKDIHILSGIYTCTRVHEEVFVLSIRNGSWDMATNCHSDLDRTLL